MLSEESMESIARFSSAEEGQTTTEYILMVATVVGIALLCIRDLVRPVVTYVTDFIEKQVGDSFRPGNFHRYRQ